MTLAAVRDVIYNDNHYLDGVKVIGVDEHHWSHNQHTWRDGNVIRPARLFDVAPERNTDTFANMAE